MNPSSGSHPRRPSREPIEALSKQAQDPTLEAGNSLPSSFSELEELISEESARVQLAFKTRPQQKLPEEPFRSELLPSPLFSSHTLEDPTSKKEKRIQKLFRERSFGFILLGVMGEAMPTQNKVAELEKTVNAIEAQKIIWDRQITNYNLERKMREIEAEQAAVEECWLVAFEDMTRTVMEALWTMYCIEMPEDISLRFKIMMREHMLRMNTISDEHEERVESILQTSLFSHVDTASLATNQVQTPADRVSSDPRLIAVLAEARIQVKELEEGRIRRDAETGRIRRH